MSPSLEPGVLPERWTGGQPDGPRAPAFHTHAYNDSAFILRQSGRTHFEKPFLYLLVGSREALLVDTGAPGADVVPAVDALLPPGRPLLVVHSHHHGDHVAGDASLRARPRTRVIEARAEAVASFFGLSRWPEETGAYDLGGRFIDVVPVPGHEAASVAIYDRRTGLLLTGDVLYAGRLYVRDARAFTASIDRLVELTRTRPVAHVLGAHIENTRRPFVDYPEGTAFQPEEHALELGRAHLLELQEALHAMGGRPERRAFRDFTIWPVAE